MTTHPPISNATDSPLLSGEGLGRRVELVETVRSLPKRHIEVTIFAAGVETLEGLKVKKLIGNSKREG